MSIKVMLADDHILFREGIRQLLEFDGSIDVVSEVSDGESCLSQLEIIKPEVLLLDINMPKKNGLEVLKQIRKNNTPVKVLILTVHNEPEYLVKAVDIGVDGYMLKDSKSTELKRAINCLMNGETYIQPSLVPILNRKLIIRDNDKEKIKLLTSIEMEVLTLVANGKLNKEIAIDLKISEQTVENHISCILKKIEVSDRTQAAVFAIKNDLVKL